MSAKSDSTKAGLRVLIAGGGTGGHVYPGIAIAKEIQRRRPTCEIHFIGTRRGIETKVVPLEGFRLETIRVSGLKGIGGVSKFGRLLEVHLSLWESRQIINRFRPDVVIGVGGYSSGPPVLMAALQGIPTLLQEQNAFPGVTNRLLSRFARKVATGFKESEPFFRGKAVLTGNPVRAEFKRIGFKTRGDQFVVLVFGGSQGAHAINSAMVEALVFLRPQPSEFFFIHQTGEKDLDWVRRSYSESGACCDVRPFFGDMPAQFEKADLLICRAGATTLAEITVAGKASLLIPFPLAADNHQQKNAEALRSAGAAEMILQSDLTGELLAGKMDYYRRHREALEPMSQRSRNLGHPDSTERIVDLVENLIHV